MSFEDDLNTPTEADWVDRDVMLNGTLYTLRFVALPGIEWANECDKYPKRPGISFDEVYGYNIRDLTLGAAPLCGSRVEGDTTVSLSAEQWASIFARIDGGTFKKISDAIFAVNEWFPAEVVKEAKKALAVSKKSSASRAPSGSRRGASSVGSRKKPPSSSTPKTGV